MLIPLLLLALPSSSSATPPGHHDAPVRVSLNDDGRYTYGDRAKVYVQTAEDGYLVVLRSDARGNVEVLSPVDPENDQYVRGGKKYEVKGRGDREAFVVENASGEGTVLAAWSRTPFDLQRYDRNGHWDFGRLDQAAGTSSQDAETRLLAVMDRLKETGAHYDYDAMKYVIYGRRYVRVANSYPYPYPWAGLWADPWWSWPRHRAGFVILPRGFRR